MRNLTNTERALLHLSLFAHAYINGERWEVFNVEALCRNADAALEEIRKGNA